MFTGNHLVDKFGMDNLETGSLLSWVMELYELGIITNKLDFTLSKAPYIN